MSLRNKITDRVVLPVSDWWLGHSVSQYFNFLMKSQYWTREEIDAYQNKRLRELVNHAINSVPYYHKLFDNLGLKPSDIQTKSDLNKIPVLTKAIIKQEGQEAFLSSTYPQKKTSGASSSGSTGEPFFYTTTKEAYSMNIAANLRGWYWMGHSLGDKYNRLSQNSRNTFIKKTQDFINQNLFYLLPSVIEQMKTGSIKLKDPRSKRDFVHVLDVVKAVQNVIELHLTGYHVFNLGSGISYSIDEMVNIFELIHEKLEINFTNEFRKGEVLDTIANINKAISVLHWSPKVEIINGIKILLYD